MTPKQQRFVAEYLLDLNATAAALRSGYKHPDIGRRLVTKSHVEKAIQAAQQKRAKRTELTMDEVIEDFREIKRRCMQAIPLLDREGNPTGEYRFDSSGANKANEMLWKHLGGEEKHRFVNENTHRVAPEDRELLRQVGERFLKEKYGLRG